MKKIFSGIFVAMLASVALSTSWETPAGGSPPDPLPEGEGRKAPFVAFRTQELPEKLTVGYAVLLVDVNGDGKKDIVVVDSARVIWFENPSWRMHTIIKGVTKADNVCIDAYDIDGDGKLDFALGA